MDDLTITSDPRVIFDQAIARGFLVYEPTWVENCIYGWLYRGHDATGNVWFQRVNEKRFLVMPPMNAPSVNMPSAQIIPFPENSKRGQRR